MSLNKRHYNSSEIYRISKNIKRIITIFVLSAISSNESEMKKDYVLISKGRTMQA